MSSNYLSLSEVAAIAPGRPHTATVWRWCRRGIRARSGVRVRLEHLRVGGRVFVEKKALDRFFASLTDSPESRGPLRHVRGIESSRRGCRIERKRLRHSSSSDRLASIDTAERECEGEGL